MMRLVWLRAVLGALFACTPSLVAVAVLGAHTVRGRPLDVQTALSVVATVNLLRAPLFSLPLVLQSLQGGQLSLRRLHGFLSRDEVVAVSCGAESGVGFEFDAAEFCWQPPPEAAAEAIAPPAAAAAATAAATAATAAATTAAAAAAATAATAATVPLDMTAREEVSGGGALPAAGGGAAARAVSGLSDEGDGEGLRPELSVPRRGDGGFWLRDLNLRGAPGELVAVVGAVGSGKTSLLRALLGELPLRHGHLALRGSVAYCAQRPFLVAGSARDNICFGTPYEPTRCAACRAAELPPHTLAHPCTPLHTRAHPCTTLHTLAHPCTPLHTLAHPCTPLHTLAHPFSL